MTEKTFLVTMNDDSRCVAFLGTSLNTVCRLARRSGCDGCLNDRPSWCPLVEHGIGDCHVKYLEQMGNLDKESEIFEKIFTKPPVNIQELVKATYGDPVYEETDSPLTRVAKQMGHTIDALAYINKMGAE